MDGTVRGGGLMKVKAFLMGAIISVMVLVLVSVSGAEGRIAQRQKRQLQRIASGVRRGEITNKEFMRLNREQWRIRQAANKAWADGRISYLERQRVHRLQDKAGQHIYRARHNRVAYFNRPTSDGHSRGHSANRPISYNPK